MLQLFDSFFSTLETLRPLQFGTALAVLGGAADWNMHPLNAVPKVQEQIDRAGLVFQIADFTCFAYKVLSKAESWKCG